MWPVGGEKRKRVEECRAPPEKTEFPHRQRAQGGAREYHVVQGGAFDGIMSNLVAHEIKLQLWEELLRDGRPAVNLTSGQIFDWRRYIRGLPLDRQHLICRGDVENVVKFCGEIHETAMCPWDNRPLFHFVAYDREGFRVLLSLHKKNRATVLFTDSDGKFMAVEQRPQHATDFCAVTPRERDICEAFGRFSLPGGWLKHRRFGSDDKTHRQWVHEFLHERGKIQHRFASRQGPTVLYSASSGASPLADIASHLVRFDGEINLRWTLSSEDVRCEWLQFLQRRMKEAPSLRNQFRESRVLEYLIHKRIFEALAALSQAFSRSGEDPQRLKQAHAEFRAATRECSQCGDQFEDISTVDDEQLRRHTWEGFWQMGVEEIHFTHDCLCRFFRDRRPLDDLRRDVKCNPQMLFARTRGSRMCLDVVCFHGKVHSINNRRLWCFREAARELQKPLQCSTRWRAFVKDGSVDDQLLLKFFDAYSTENGGTSVSFYR